MEVPMTMAMDSSASEALYAAAFTQVQECGDIISSILIIYKFITENSLPVAFSADKLRGIALRSADKDTCTYLWHINALIAASSDFEHLLLGIEMMFDRFLGNKDLFIKEKEKQKAKETLSSKSSSKANHKFIGNEIVSFVNSHYDQQQNQNNNNEEQHAQPMPPPPPSQSQPYKKSLSVITANNNCKHEWQMPAQIVTTQNDENENTQNMGTDTARLSNISDENREYMNKYRGKISSPISFRMRQQKRMMQSGRRTNSRNAPRNTSIDLAVYVNGDGDGDKDDNDEQDNVVFHAKEPEILSPFNVTKFAKKVDLMEKGQQTPTRLIQFER